jgi:acyl carrier protein
VVSAIRTSLGSSHGLDVHAIFLLGPTSLPKTSSGKVQRQATKQLLLSDQLPTLHVWRKVEIIEAQSDLGDSILARCRVLLGDPTLGVDDNLFALGLDSLKAMELITDLETAFQRVIDPAAFTDAPTVRGLINLIDVEKSTALPMKATEPNLTEAIWPFGRLNDTLSHDLKSFLSAWNGEWTSPNRLIFGMNVKGSKPPLFWCFQGHDEMIELARHLGAEQPLFGMRSAGALSDYKNRQDNTSLAALYLEEMIKYLPQPYYLLGGNCQGGLLMTRLALLLSALGEDVRHLFILENIDIGVNSSVLPFGISMFFGRDSHKINPFLRFPAPTGTWNALYPAGYTIDFINCGHAQYFKHPNIVDLAEKLTARLQFHGSHTRHLLPHYAMRALLEANIPARMPAGSKKFISIRVTNISPMTWAAGPPNSLIVANHWFDENNKKIGWLDGYSPIIDDFEANTHRQMVVQVIAPASPGKYVLEFDLANQGIAWFKEKGSTTLRRKVLVEAVDSE